MPKKPLDVDSIHRTLRLSTYGLENELMRVLFSTRMADEAESEESASHLGMRKRGHETRADRDLALTSARFVSDKLSPYVDLKWEVQHVKADEIPSTSRPDFHNVPAFAYPLPGHGNTTRALAPYEGRYLSWDDPKLPRDQVNRNAAILIGLDYPTELSTHGKKSKSMVSIMKLHDGEILSAMRRDPRDKSSSGYRGDKQPVPLDPADYKVDPTKAPRIILTNYLGSVANDQHFGVFRRRAREYCQLFGPPGFDVSFDGSEWNTACDIGSAMIVRHQANGIIDPRFLTPNINPRRDATLQVFDIKVPVHIAETVNFYTGTTNEEPLESFHDMNELDQPLDAMILADDLINGTLGFDFREAVLEGRIASMRSFYETEGSNIGIPEQITLDAGLYLFNQNTLTGEELQADKQLDHAQLEQENSYDILSNAGAQLLKNQEYTSAKDILERARTSIEEKIKVEMNAKQDDIRTDYTEILKLRKYAAAIYSNLAKDYLGIAIHTKDTTTDDADISGTDRRLQEEPSPLMSAKHFFDLAVLHNPHDHNLLYQLGKIHEEYDEKLLNVDRLGALRRTRIFFKYTLEQIDQEISQANSATGSTSELAQRKAEVLSDYLPILEELATKHPGLQSELHQLRTEMSSLNTLVGPYGTLERLADEKGKDFGLIKGSIDSIGKEDTTKAAMADKAVKLLRLDKDCRERDLILAATTTIPNYNLEDVIGAGAYGVVFKGRNSTDTDTLRAIKIIDTVARTYGQIQEAGLDETQYAIQEYRRAQQAWKDHTEIQPFIVQLLEITADSIANRAIIIQELLDTDFLSYQRTWEEDKRSECALEFTLDLAQALDAIHGADLYHKDLSPGNILVETNGKTHYKLADFGLSRLRDEINNLGCSIAAVQIRDVQTGDDGLADIYSWGCNVALAYSNEYPFAPPDMNKPDDLYVNDKLTAVQLKEYKAERDMYEAEVLRLKQSGLDRTRFMENAPSGLTDIVADVLNPDHTARTIRDAKTLLERVKGVYEDAQA